MNQVYRINRQKEYKTLVIAAIVFFFLLALFTWLGY